MFVERPGEQPRVDCDVSYRRLAWNLVLTIPMVTFIYALVHRSSVCLVSTDDYLRDRGETS